MQFALNEFVITPSYDGAIEFPKILPAGTAVDNSFLHLHLLDVSGFDNIYLTLKKVDY